ncbi:MAG: hypothetical protein NVS3B20_15760 [Polyangiales bacterium]
MQLRVVRWLTMHAVRVHTLRAVAVAALAAPIALTTVGCASSMPSARAADSSSSQHPLLRKVAPEVDLPLAKAGSFRPSQSAGRVLVIDYWATWCEPCKASFPKLDAIYRRHRGEGLSVVGISEDDDSKQIPRFIRETGVTFDIALDPGGPAAKRYRVEAVPTQFIIDRRGVVRFVHADAGDADVIEREVESLLKESI